MWTLKMYKLKSKQMSKQEERWGSINSSFRFHRDFSQILIMSINKHKNSQPQIIKIYKKIKVIEYQGEDMGGPVTEDEMAGDEK